MQWEQSAVEKLNELVLVVRDPFREIIRNSAQSHAERYAESRKNPHVGVREAVLGFLRARSHKLTAEGLLILHEYQMEEDEFLKYNSTTQNQQ